MIAGVKEIPTTTQHHSVTFERKRGTPRLKAYAANNPVNPSSKGTPTTASMQLPQIQMDRESHCTIA